MRVLLDTNVVVAGLVERHPRYPTAKPWLDKARSGKIEAFVSDRTLAEAYAIISTLPLRPQLHTIRVIELVNDLVSRVVRPVSLTAAECLRTLHRLAGDGLRGGVIYDGFIAAAAVKAHVDRLITWNTRDFLRVWPLDPRMIQEP